MKFTQLVPWLMRLGATASLCFALGANAHTDLLGSVPAANSALTEAPAQLELTYGAAVNLVKLTLATERGGPVAINFKPSSRSAKRFSLGLPELPAGAYKVEWTALGADGHMLQDSFDFRVLDAD